MNVLIIEDEIKTARELKKFIEATDDQITVLQILPSVSAAIQWFKEHPSPDLIFSDIQLADGLSFDIFREVAVQAPVIFCTAFDEYAIRAFKANGIDFLLKPVDEDKLAQSLEKYRHLKKLFSAEREQYGQQLAVLSGQLDNQYKRSILVHLGEQIIPVKTAEISFVYAAGGMVNIYTTDNRQYVCQHTLDQMETILQPQQFFRANRQFMINLDSILKVEHYFNRRLYVKLNVETPERIIVSRVKSGDLLTWMEM